MSIKSWFVALTLLFTGQVSFAGLAPIEKATSALVAQLVDSYAHEYPEARRVHAMPGNQGVTLVFFTIEGFNQGNNYTYYLAAFQEVAPSGPFRPAGSFQLLGFAEVGGSGWRSVDFEHFKTAGECVALYTKEYAADDPMSRPSIPGTATYCLSTQNGISNPSLDITGHRRTAVLLDVYSVQAP